MQKLIDNRHKEDRDDALIFQGFFLALGLLALAMV